MSMFIIKIYNPSIITDSDYNGIRVQFFSLRFINILRRIMIATDHVPESNGVVKKSFKPFPFSCMHKISFPSKPPKSRFGEKSKFLFLGSLKSPKSPYSCELIWGSIKKKKLSEAFFEDSKKRNLILFDNHKNYVLFASFVLIGNSSRAAIKCCLSIFYSS